MMVNTQSTSLSTEQSNSDTTRGGGVASVLDGYAGAGDNMGVICDLITPTDNQTTGEQALELLKEFLSDDIIKKLLNNDAGITQLELSRKDLYSRHAAALMLFLPASNTTITSLNLGFNNISDEV